MTTYTIIKSIVFLLILIIASVQDIKKREVSDLIHVSIFIISFIGFNIEIIPAMILGAVVSALPLFIAAMIKKDSIGGADIKMMAASGLILGAEKGILALIISLIIALIITLFIRFLKHKVINESFPLIPYLSFGIIIVYIF